MFFFLRLLALVPARSGTLQKIRHGVRGRKHWFEDLRAQLQPFALSRPRVWIHAASMGECEQAKSILRELGKRLPEAVRVLTVFSPSAYLHIVRENFPAEVMCYLPFDSLRQVDKFYDLLHPRAGVVIRHDYWPNFIWQAKRRGIFLLLANASVSANANSLRHKPIVRSFHREVFSNFDVIAAVSAFAVETLRPLIRHPERIGVVGDTRFEQVLYRSQHAAPHHILPQAWRDADVALVAGSTWPSDDEILIPALAALCHTLPGLHAILVPHEPTESHMQSVERLLRSHGLSGMRLSQAETSDRQTILLVDRIGVLAELYGAGKIAYVGGGFGPGVHSVLEAAAHGVPVLFGPRHHNSVEALEMSRLGIGGIIGNAEQGERELARLLHNEGTRTAWGRRCSQYVHQKAGAARTIVDFLAPHISA